MHDLNTNRKVNLSHENNERLVSRTRDAYSSIREAEESVRITVISVEGVASLGLDKKADAATDQVKKH